MFLVSILDFSYKLSFAVVQKRKTVKDSDLSFCVLLFFELVLHKFVQLLYNKKEYMSKETSKFSLQNICY